CARPAACRPKLLTSIRRGGAVRPSRWRPAPRQPTAARRGWRPRTNRCAPGSDMALSVPTVSVVGSQFHRVRRILLRWLSLWTNAILFTGLSLVLGIGSGLYLVDTGSRLTTQRSGPWIMWSRAGQRDIDPYTRARYAKLGGLPVSTQIAA